MVYTNSGNLKRGTSLPLLQHLLFAPELFETAEKKYNLSVTAESQAYFQFIGRFQSGGDLLLKEVMRINYARCDVLCMAQLE